MSRVCASLCVYDTQTIAECKQCAYRCMRFLLSYAQHVLKRHVCSCITLLFTPETLLTQLKYNGHRVFRGCATIAGILAQVEVGAYEIVV